VPTASLRRLRGLGTRSAELLRARRGRPFHRGPPRPDSAVVV